MINEPHLSERDTRPYVYRGRFAPSPSGDLHFGSLIAAVGSYLQARQQQGEWQVRIDDIDPPREIPGASDQILHSLEHYGFEWDGEVTYQSRRQEIYQWAVETLQEQGLIYPCGCTRKSLAAHLDPKRPEVYPGLCRQGLPPGEKGRSLRVLCQQTTIRFDDRIQGPQQMDLERDCGDFVIKRADGLFAYQLATAVDDAAQGMTEVIRGSDLLESTFRQLHLQQLLSLPSPVYAHLPVATNAHGDKLSKKTRARSIMQLPVEKTLYQVLQFLGQNPPAELQRVPWQEIWAWAFENWDLDRVPQQRQIVFKNSNKN